MEGPSFYLASNESHDLTKAWQFFEIKRLAVGIRDDAMLVRIDPHFSGQEYGLGSGNIDVVIVASRFVGESLDPVSMWPLHV